MPMRFGLRMAPKRPAVVSALREVGGASLASGQTSVGPPRTDGAYVYGREKLAGSGSATIRGSHATPGSDDACKAGVPEPPSSSRGYIASGPKEGARDARRSSN